VFVGEDARALAFAWDTGTAPTVGSSLTLLANDAKSEDRLQQWSVIESRAHSGGNDLVMHGTYMGKRVAYLYDGVANHYVSCGADAQEAITREDIISALSQEQAHLSLLGLAPGNGSCSYFSGLPVAH
jgi:hypothetical protein